MAKLSPLPRPLSRPASGDYQPKSDVFPAQLRGRLRRSATEKEGDAAPEVRRGLGAGHLAIHAERFDLLRRDREAYGPLGDLDDLLCREVARLAECARRQRQAVEDV